MTLIVIGEKHYPLIDMEKLSLKHTLVLQRELAVTGISSARSWQEAKELVRQFQTMSKAERESHPEALFLTALTIWAARVSTGEDLTLLEAVDVPLSEIRFVREPTDRQAPEGKAGPRPGGGAKRSTSKKKSTSAS